MRTSGERLWIIIKEPRVCWHGLFRWDKLQLSSAIKDRVRGNVLGRQRSEPPPAPHVSWQSIFCSELCSMCGHFGTPSRCAPLFPPLCLSTPPYRGAGTLRGGERGSEGQSLFLFGSWGLLGEAWLENDCIRAGVGGSRF